MIDANSVNDMGLALDIIGVILIYIFGIRVARVEEYVEARVPSWHRLMSHLGMCMIIAGFALQLLSNHWDSLDA